MINLLGLLVIIETILQIKRTPRMVYKPATELLSPIALRDAHFKA